MKLLHDGNMPYWEGQSLGVTPPGTDANGKPHKVSEKPRWSLFEPNVSCVHAL